MSLLHLFLLDSKFFFVTANVPPSVSSSLSPLSSLLPDRSDDDEPESESESESDPPSPLRPPPDFPTFPLLLFRLQPGPRTFPSWWLKGVLCRSAVIWPPSSRASSSAASSFTLGISSSVFGWLRGTMRGAWIGGGGGGACWFWMNSSRAWLKVNWGSAKMESSVRLTPCSEAPSISWRSWSGIFHQAGSSELVGASGRRSSREGWGRTLSRRRRRRLIRYRVREARSSVMGATVWESSDGSEQEERTDIYSDYELNILCSYLSTSKGNLKSTNQNNGRVTFTTAWPQVANSPAHGNKRAEVSTEALICFFIQTSEGTEAVPVIIWVSALRKTLLLFYFFHTKSGHHAVEVALFSTCPPAQEDRRQVKWWMRRKILNIFL